MTLGATSNIEVLRDVRSGSGHSSAARAVHPHIVIVDHLATRNT